MAPRRTTEAGGPVVAGVRISHPERVVFPDAGFTKLDLARFYETIADAALPHLVGRPLTLLRCPDGAGPSCVYMRHGRVWTWPALRRVSIPEKHKIGEYLVVEDLAGLVSLVQMDILEIHTWNSVADDVERPNRIVIDLDPGPEVRWSAVVAGARRVRAVLQALELVPFVKTTGGNGLHVVVPLRPVHDWSACLAFARAVAEVLVRDDPATFTTSLPKADRADKILLDYLRNNRTNTSVAAFSTRASGRGPLSVPITWEELQTIGSSNRYDVRNVRGRIARLRRDPWRDYDDSAREIPAGALDALRRTL
jgi:bifunctional non-homologous end joining protein LigD